MFPPCGREAITESSTVQGTEKPDETCTLVQASIIKGIDF